MSPCPSCRRLHRAEEACPFCRARRTRLVAAVAIATAIGTTACYGGPSKHDRAYTSPAPEPSSSAAPETSK